MSAQNIIITRTFSSLIQIQNQTPHLRYPSLPFSAKLILFLSNCCPVNAAQISVLADRCCFHSNYWCPSHPCRKALGFLCSLLIHWVHMWNTEENLRAFFGQSAYQIQRWGMCSINRTYVCITTLETNTWIRYPSAVRKENLRLTHSLKNSTIKFAIYILTVSANCQCCKLHQRPEQSWAMISLLLVPQLLIKILLLELSYSAWHTCPEHKHWAVHTENGKVGLCQLYF